VAVLDSGIEKEHPDLRGRVAGYVYAHPDVPNVSGERDIIGHGTHVSGTVAALINNNLGINGICNCRLLAWKIFDDQEDFFRDAFVYLYFVDTVMYMRALADCLEQGVDVINLSIGGGGRPDPQEQQLFDALLASGTVIVAAMGNEREDGSPISYPAAIPGVIAVGATSIDDTVAEFSNHGDHISLSAPGVAIWSTLPRYPGQSGFDAVLGPGNRPVKGRPRRRETDYGAWDGTSMASPHVAAAAALLTAKHGRLGPEETRRRLMRKSDRVAGMGGANFHPDFGAGRLNLLRLLS
jgi:subtilisin family serine protease